MLVRRAVLVAVLAALVGAAPVGVAAAPPDRGRGGGRGPAAPAQASPYRGHGRASVSREVLRRYAPRPLDRAVARRLQSFLDLRAPGLGLVAPGGKRLFFTWRVTGTSQVWRLDGPQRFPVQLTGGQDTTFLAGITPDGAWLVVGRDRDGEENPGLYLQRPAGGPLVLVQHLPGVRTTLQFISDDSRFLYYRANDRRPDSYALYRYEIATGTREPIFTRPGLWRVADHRPDGRLLLARATGALTSEYHELDPRTGRLTPLLGVGEREEYDAVYGAAPGELLVLTNKLGEFRRLYRFADGRLVPVTPALSMDVERFSVDRPKRHLLVTLNDGGYSRLTAYDARTFKPLKLPAFKNADHVYAGATTRDGRYTSLGVETSKAPRQSYVYDWRTRRLTQWVIAATPEVDTSAFVAATIESYPARDGTSIPMLVRRPTHCVATPCPVVVHFHGGPEGQSRPGFSPGDQLFVEAGFMLVEPNVRGSDGYGKTWLHADDGPKREQVITDIEDCARYIKKAWAVGGRAPKLAVYGGSYGGYSALMAMTRFAGAYDVGVSIVGISDLVTFLENTAPYRRILRMSEYGDPRKDRAALVRLSPVTYLDRVKGPLLLIQGANDPRVPVGEAVQIQRALEAKKVPSTLMILPDEGHGAAKRQNVVLMFGHALAFLKRHLAP
jgi:dipeptidyl aminopeptidase/acylaminoacyl peptidase